MSNSDWLTCRNPWVMLGQLGLRASERKLRLFICACCRRQLDRLSSHRLSEVLTTIEDRIDLPVTTPERERLSDAIHALALENRIIADALDYAIPPEPNVSAGAGFAVDFLVSAWAEALPHFNEDEERAAQCQLLREIFGYSFRPLAIDPRCRTSTPVALAQAVYDEGAFDRLPILADALEEAGCTDAEILRHCREPEIHVKGCWLVDLILDKP